MGLMKLNTKLYIYKKETTFFESTGLIITLNVMFLIHIYCTIDDLSLLIEI